MKPHHDFTAERAVAQHCGELLANSRARDDKQDDRAQCAARFVDGLCEGLPDRIQPLLIGRRSRVSAGDAATQTAASLMREIVRPSACYSMTLPSTGMRLLVSFDHAIATSLTDRLFGGDGQVDSDNAPTAPLPISSSMALQRVVKAIAATICDADDDADLVIAHDSDVTRLMPFPRGEYCTGWTLTTLQEGCPDWSVRIATLECDLAATAAGRKISDNSAANQPLATLASRASFADVPLEMRAVLAEMKLPIARIAGLSPGDILPLAPRREVPLQIGGGRVDRTLGFGSIGTLDDRVALQLTRIT